MQGTLIDQGLNLMLYGMGTVFVFLTILVFATSFMSRIVQRFATPDDAPDSGGLSPAQDAAPNPELAPPHILKAIHKAIAAHRSRR